MLPHLAQARADREADIAALADMDDNQLTYLSMVDYLDDSITDELECDSEIRERW